MYTVSCAGDSWAPLCLGPSVGAPLFRPQYPVGTTYGLLTGTTAVPTIGPRRCRPNTPSLPYSIVRMGIADSTLYSTVQYRTVPYSTVQYRTVPYSILQDRTVPYRFWSDDGSCPELMLDNFLPIPDAESLPCYPSVLKLVVCTVSYRPYRTVQYSTVSNSTVQYSTVPYSTEQYRTVPNSVVQYRT